MSNESTKLTDPLPPRQEILHAAYLEEVRYSEENLKHRRKSSPLYTYVALAVAAALVGLIVYALLHR